MAQPAIILITCDELRRDALSFYGNQAVHTPNIDAIAKAGTAFDNAYTVSPLCLPARCSIITGRYPHRSGAYSNFRESPLKGGGRNLFTMMNGAGYTTSVIGKCHFAPADYGAAKAGLTLPNVKTEEYYKSLGMDTLILQDDKLGSLWFYDDYSRELDQAGYLAGYRERHWNGGHHFVYEFPGPAHLHPDAWVGAKATETIARDDGAKPLFLWVSFSGPHYPFDAPKEYLERVDQDKLPPRVFDPKEYESPGRIHFDSYHGGENTCADGCFQATGRACKNYDEDYWRRLRVSYHANMALIDDYVGRIVAAVKEKYGDDYLLIFTADHGEMLGDHGIWGKQDCAFDSVLRIPLFVKFPNRGAAPRTGAMVNTCDLFPTFMEAAGEQPRGCDGKNLRVHMESGGLEYTFAESEGFVTATDGNMKYVHIQKWGGNFRELYDLRNDPYEYTNLADDPAYAPALAALREKVIEHFMPKVLP